MTADTTVLSKRYSKVAPKGGGCDGPTDHQKVHEKKRRRFLRSSYCHGSMLIMLFSTISWWCYQYNTILLKVKTEKRHNPTTVLHVQEWHSKKFSGGTDLVQIVHWPGLAQQIPAYNDCMEFIQTHQTHSWIAFIDLDEFIEMKDMNKYPHIMDLLDTVPQDAGGLTLNWQVFHWNNQTRYEPKPLSLRFDHYRTNKHVKTIARADRIQSIHIPHCMIYKKGFKAVDSNGDIVEGPINERMPMDVAAINHYGSKSLEEYMLRCKRGRATIAAVQTADTYHPCKPENEIIAEWKRSKTPSYFDNQVWELLKERVPIYKDKYE